jgi:hypothetical protein
MEDILKPFCAFCGNKWGLKNEIFEGYEDLFFRFLKE